MTGALVCLAWPLIPGALHTWRALQRTIHNHTRSSR